MVQDYPSGKRYRLPRAAVVRVRNNGTVCQTSTHFPVTSARLSTREIARTVAVARGPQVKDYSGRSRHRKLNNRPMPVRLYVTDLDVIVGTHNKFAFGAPGARRVVDDIGRGGVCRRCANRENSENNANRSRNTPQHLMLPLVETADFSQVTVSRRYQPKKQRSSKFAQSSVSLRLQRRLSRAGIGRFRW